MKSIEQRTLVNLIDYFSEGFWLDAMHPDPLDPAASEVSLRHDTVRIEGISEETISIARKAAAVAVTSGSWRPEII